MILPPPHPPAVVCVAEAVYHESRSAPVSDQYRVAELVWNRARDIKKSPCYITKMKGQFPWAHKHKKINDSKSWSQSLHIASTTKYHITRVRYMVNTSHHRPARNIHVLHKDKHLVFYNRYEDNVWTSEKDFSKNKNRHSVKM